MKGSKRLFFGVAASADAAIRIADWRDRHAHCDGRAVVAANFHMTLAFIGELQTGKLESLAQATDDLLERQMPLSSSLTLDQLGYWPKPGIFWLGPQTWPEALSELAQNLRSLVGSVGGSRERNRFQPHITLFRRCNTAPSLPSLRPAIEFGLENITLFESVQGRQGVRYDALFEWSMNHSRALELT